MENIIALVILVCVTAGIIFYLRKLKKQGGKCAGCPYCKQCQSAKEISCEK